ncbi:MAG: chemotaxis protein CheD [Spirochaetales bacterium]|nr:chemotaxis protein CheD [Spirochaetales bacterium]
MYRYFNTKFNRELIDISPGEFYATGDDVVISTVLGSCVAVSLYDSERKMAGMNHFMLVEGKDVTNTGELMRLERYGSFAMESLLNEFIRGGSLKANLQAKVFGGSRLLGSEPASSTDIGHQNVLYALNFLKNEGIPVLAKDTGGKRSRRLYLFPQTFKILMKKEKKRAFSLDELPVSPKKIESPVILFDKDE